RRSTTAVGHAEFGAGPAVGASFGVELRPGDLRGTDEIERAIAAFAAVSNGGLIVTQNSFAILHRKLIITLAARHRLPAIYAYSSFVTDGGLISYGLIRWTATAVPLATSIASSGARSRRTCRSRRRPGTDSD